MRLLKNSVLIIFLFSIFTISTYAEEKGNLNPKLIKKFAKNYQSIGDQEDKINALTNNDIKKLSLNRKRLLEHEDYINFKLESSDITNQKSTGRCWMYAGGNVYSPKIMINMKLGNFEISHSYLAFWDKMEKANLFLENIIKYRDREFGDRDLETILDSPLGDGGWWHYFADLVDKYGIVPNSVMPETKQSNATGNVNKLATRIIRKTASNIRQMHHWGKKVKELRQVKEDALNEVYRLLIYTYGQPPEKFDFRIESKDTTIASEDTTVASKDTTIASKVRNFTPKSFASEFLGDQTAEYVTLVNLPTREFNNIFELEDSRNLFEKEDMLVLNLTSEKLQEYTLASLKDTQGVWFACDVGKENYNDSGILALDIYDYNRTFDMDFKMSKKDRINFNEISPNHAMAIMGADTTDSGKVRKWLVENSWGSKRGDDGFWYMYNDWFDEYVLMIIVDKKLLSEDDLKLYDKKPIKIPVWEPFFLALRKLEGMK